MTRQRTFDDELFAHFVTFSCYKRRRLLDHDRAKKIVLDVLDSQLQKQAATCVGFVVLPDHVHAIVWFPVVGQLRHFMKQWKQRSSVQIKRLLQACLTGYARTIENEKGVRNLFLLTQGVRFRLHPTNLGIPDSASRLKLELTTGQQLLQSLHHRIMNLDHLTLW